MDVPGGGQGDPNPFSPGFSPTSGFVLDLVSELNQRWGYMVKDTRISILPDHPRHQECNRSERFAERVWRGISCPKPPVLERGILVWHRSRQAQPGHDLMPGLSRECACEQQVPDRFRLLVAEEAPRVVGEAMAGETLCSPAAVLVGEPMKELNLRRRPAFPNQLPRAASNGSVEGGPLT